MANVVTVVLCVGCCFNLLAISKVHRSNVSVRLMTLIR